VDANNIGHTDMTYSTSADFIATADSRDTSVEIMEAIAFFSRDRNESEAIWDGEYSDELLAAIAAHATANGRIDPADLDWGAFTLAEVIKQQMPT
jgi:hypothetical protein